MSLDDLLIKRDSLKERIKQLAVLRNKVSAVGCKNLCLLHDDLTVALSTVDYSVPEEIFTKIEESIESKIAVLKHELFSVNEELNKKSSKC